MLHRLFSTAPAKLTLSKALSNTGVCSRRAAEKIISSGRVLVDGVKVDKNNALVDPRAKLSLDGVPLKSSPAAAEMAKNAAKQIDDAGGNKASKQPPAVPRLWAVYKKRGELVATDDLVKDRPLLFTRIKRLLPKISDVRPIGRLEFNAEGLLLLTNSGLLAQKLCKAPLECTYSVRVEGVMTESKLKGLRKGFVSEGVKYHPMANLVIDKEKSKGNSTWMTITQTNQVRKEQMKKSLDKLFLKWSRIVCTKVDAYSLADMAEGEVRELSISPKINMIFKKI